MITLPNAAITDHIGVYPNAFSPLMCEQIIDYMESKFTRAKETALENGVDVDDGSDHDFDGVNYRNNSKRIDASIELGNFTTAEPLVQKCLPILEQYSNHYFESYDSPYLWSDCERMQIKCQKSANRGGFCDWHYEQGNDSHCARRFAVWMVYLNDVTKGGRTEFKQQGISLQPEEGTLVIWPAAYTHMHRAAPDLEQDKYIATGWYVYEASADPKRS